MSSFSITLGALCDPIAKQLADAGAVADPEEIRICQLIADAISVVGVHGYVSPSATIRARQKLVRRIGAALNRAAIQKAPRSPAPKASGFAGGRG